MVITGIASTLLKVGKSSLIHCYRSATPHPHLETQPAIRFYPHSTHATSNSITLAFYLRTEDVQVRGNEGVCTRRRLAQEHISRHKVAAYRTSMYVRKQPSLTTSDSRLSHSIRYALVACSQELLRVVLPWYFVAGLRCPSSTGTLKPINHRHRRHTGPRTSRSSYSNRLEPA